MFRPINQPIIDREDYNEFPPKKKPVKEDYPIDLRLLIEKVRPVLEECLISGHYVLFAGVLNGSELQIKGVGDNFPDELLPELSKKLEEALCAITVNPEDQNSPCPPNGQREVPPS